MTLLNKKVKKEIEDIFRDLHKEVTIKFFTQEIECRFCQETHGLLDELAALTPLIKLEVFDLLGHADEAKRYQVERIPALVVMDEHDYGIRFYGIPSGYEFTSLIEAIKMVSNEEEHLSLETKMFLDKLESDVHLQVFVTPTCPYCPPAVILAQRMAYYSTRVRSEMIEAVEFPQLAIRHTVSSVPLTVINGTVTLPGAVPEHMLVDKIREALTKK
jgi:glutaredoxin-like protein